MAEAAQPEDRPSAARPLAEVDELIAAGRHHLRFPEDLERAFQSEISSIRAKHFSKISIFGILTYDAFLITDYLLVPDIFFLCIAVKLLLMTPALALIIGLIHKRVIRPEIPMAVSILAVVASVMLLYSQSTSSHAPLMIFFLPPCLAFGNVVLPLPFRMSVCFTGLCMSASSAAVFVSADWNGTPCAFVLLTNVNLAAFMLIATYRMEASERRAYLFGRRETLRAETLSETNRHLQNLSETDGLTGVANRRFFDSVLAAIEARPSRSEPVSLLLVDIDHFKRLNDSFGHQAGDDVLRMVASCLTRHTPPGSIVARYGGEEFAVTLPGADAEAACSCAESLRSAIERLAPLRRHDHVPAGLTVSIGFATLEPGSLATTSDVVAAADLALYRAKASGRNRVHGLPLVADGTSQFRPAETVR